MTGRRSRLAHLVMILVGLVILAYPFTLGTAPLSCRGTTMRPGDVCLKADGSMQQSYEQRLATRRQAVPVIVVVGVAVVAFGTSLLVTDVRRRRTIVPPG